MLKIKVYSDGSCHSVKGGNQPMGCGVYASINDTAIFEEAYSPKTRGTVNLSEWMALARASKLISSYVKSTSSNCTVLFHCDSRLVVNQFNGDAYVKKPEFRKLKDLCLKNMSSLKDYRVIWIPRERNQDADRLAGEARQESKKYFKVV